MTGRPPDDPFDPNVLALRVKLAALRDEHRALDAETTALGESGYDQIKLARLKKRKLAIKDEINALEDVLLPDIIA